MTFDELKSIIKIKRDLTIDFAQIKNCYVYAILFNDSKIYIGAHLKCSGWTSPNESIWWDERQESIDFSKFERIDYQGSSDRLKNALRKHGKSNFTKVLLAETDTWEQALILESYFLSEEIFLKHADKFYNRRHGGRTSLGKGTSYFTDGVNEIKLFPYEDVPKNFKKGRKPGVGGNGGACKGLPAWNKGKTLSDSYCQILSNAKLGKLNPNFNKARSDKTKNSIREAQLGELNNAWGSKWMSKYINFEWHCKRVHLEEINTYLLNGWQFKRMSLTLLNKKKRES